MTTLVTTMMMMKVGDIDNDGKIDGDVVDGNDPINREGSIYCC